MNVRHIIGISSETAIAVLSSKASFFDHSLWVLQSSIVGLYISTLNTESSNSQ